MELESSAARINILAVVDTEYVKSTYPSPSQNRSKPTEIDFRSWYSICTGARNIVYTQEKAELGFMAHHGSRVALRAISIYNNSDDAVIAYKITYRQKEPILNRCKVCQVTRNGAVQPDPDSLDGGVPPIQAKLNFSSLNFRIITAGNDLLNICFGLYCLADDGQTQQLFGYYSGKLGINVTTQSASNEL